MGQPQSSEEGNRHETVRPQQDDSIPYTKYSQSKPNSITSGKSDPPSTVRGVTVVNPKPDHDLHRNRPVELQKLDKIHRFWPILKSSVQNSQSAEKISDGLEYMDILAMCIRYQEHLRDTAVVVSIEQRALASRLKDLEMFSAGIAQQVIRRQERMQRALTQLEKVREVSTTLEAIHTSIEECVPLLHRLNQLLPEAESLEPFQLHPSPHNPPEEDNPAGELEDSSNGVEPEELETDYVDLHSEHVAVS